MFLSLWTRHSYCITSTICLLLLILVSIRFLYIKIPRTNSNDNNQYRKRKIWRSSDNLQRFNTRSVYTINKKVNFSTYIGRGCPPRQENIGDSHRHKEETPVSKLTKLWSMTLYSGHLVNRTEGLGTSWLIGSVRPLPEPVSHIPSVFTSHWSYRVITMNWTRVNWSPTNIFSIPESGKRDFRRGH